MSGSPVGWHGEPGTPMLTSARTVSPGLRRLLPGQSLSTRAGTPGCLSVVTALSHWACSVSNDQSAAFLISVLQAQSVFLLWLLLRFSFFAGLRECDREECSTALGLSGFLDRLVYDFVKWGHLQPLFLPAAVPHPIPAPRLPQGSTRTEPCPLGRRALQACSLPGVHPALHRPPSKALGRTASLLLRLLSAC